MTGAGSGIGRAVALRLAEEGATVVAASRTRAHAEASAAELADAVGREALPLAFDLRDGEAVARAVDEVAERYGRIDILSSNAGVDDASEPPVAETSDELWNETLDVNLRGVFWLCRAAIPSLADGGSIVTMASNNAFAARPNAAAYVASKGALLQFTRALALELAPRRIRANCVCPGATDTPLTAIFLARAEDPEALRASFLDDIPLRRLATPREIANCVLFLASDEASYVTGAALVADGGDIA